MTEPTDSPPHANHAANTNEIDDTILGDVARKAYADRRRREQIAGMDGMFGEPAWDILLELFIAAHEGRHLPAASASRFAAVPDTVAQRWIAILVKRGVAVENGGFVELSAAAYAGMADYFRKS